jgi:proteasome accessory factor C
MSATNDVARMLTLVPWLIERPGATLDEAAEAFGVGPEVIRRDLGHLDFCGLPGLGGGDLFDVSLVGDRVVVTMADELRRPLRPTPHEALRLVLTVDAVADVLGEDLPALRSAVDKVRAALGIPEDVADVVDDQAPAALEQLRTALHDRRRVRLGYQGRADTAPLEREVDPWALHVRDGVWYLQGHDHGADGGRTFRLDRVADVEVLDDPVEVAAPEQLPPPGYAPGSDDLEVVLDLSPSARWLAAALLVDELEELDDDTTRVRLRTDAPRWVARLVLMAGGGAKVVAPETVRDEVLAMARAALADELPPA